MDKQRTRRLLLVAFALSILIHTLFASAVRWHPGSAEDTTQVIEKVRVFHPMHVARVIPTPTPPPSASPAPSAAPTARKPTLPGANGQGVAVAVRPTPAASAAPATAPSATPNCAKADIPAAIAATPPPPDIAPGARADAANGIARVRVQLDTNGTVTDAAVVTSSGSGSLDLVAVSLAKAARYAPATHDCKAVASYYDFTARFQPW
jgi:TonB family protein